MKILIINQPVANRGDESAHKALVRSLSKKYPDSSIDVVYFGEIYENAKPMEANCPNLHYEYVDFQKGLISIAYHSIKYNLGGLITSLIPAYRKLDQKIKSSDYVICAPGGICLGGFMDWNHLFWLMRAKQHKKKLAYYSRSFGPFDTSTPRKALFKKKSIEILNYFDFLSIRDGKTMELARQLNLNYVPSIDTAFLERVDCKSEIDQLSLSSEYIIFVPNSLTWHPAYKNVSSQRIASFYEDLINALMEKNPNNQIVMLPQLFGKIYNRDYDFFNVIKEKSRFKEQILVLNDNLSSDIQQTIIKHSRLVVGARYHSIVFAINNEIPFVSLSYEHKMFGLLEILSLENRQIDITQIGTKSFDEDKAIQEFRTILNEQISVAQESKIAKSIAQKCFDQLTSSFLK